MSYSIVLFDFDGTLCDSAEGIIQGMSLTFEAQGLPRPTPEAVRAVIGLRIEECFQRLCPELAPDDIPGWIAVYREEYFSRGHLLNRLFPGVVEILADLKRRGVIVGVASNKGQPGLERAVENLGIAGYCDVLAGARPDLPRKPEAAFYDSCVAPSLPGADPGQILMVGDTPTDLRFAVNVGMPACYAAWGYGNREECLSLRPRHVSDSPLALAGIWK
ncbi:HAD hydrolase-like protein [Desulfovibrio aminophilus]|uniref:HAD family hydrolase n=1 Tax=Desulfovibrio aminophilus TaxID=81425 RepID=UPI003392E9F1